MEFLPEYLIGIGVIILCTAFVKLATVLGILRQALGLKDIASGIAILALALALSFLVAQPITSKSVNQKGTNLKSEVEKFKPFLTANTDKEVLTKLSNLKSEKTEISQSSSEFLVAAFLISELKQAFELGLLILIPFIVIDLLVVNVLMLLGIESISATLFSLPLKLLLFVSLNGWQLISEKLLSAYL